MMIPLVRCPDEQKIEICVAEDDGGPYYYKNIYVAEVTVEQAKEFIIKLAIAIDIVEEDKRRVNFV